MLWYPHDEHAGHGQAPEHVEQMTFFQYRLVAIDQITDSSLR